MYTTAEAVRLLVRAALASDGRAPVLEPEFQVVSTLVDLNVVTHCCKRHASRWMQDGEGYVEHWIELTDVGRTVWRELQREFEALLALCRAADDRRPRK